MYGHVLKSDVTQCILLMTRLTLYLVKDKKPIQGRNFWGAAGAIAPPPMILLSSKYVLRDNL